MAYNSQIVMFDQLVDWFASTWLPWNVHSPIMNCNVGNMFGENGCVVCYQVNSLRCIVGTVEAWQLPLPVVYDIRPIFPSNGMLEINI